MSKKRGREELKGDRKERIGEIGRNSERDAKTNSEGSYANNYQQGRGRVEIFASQILTFGRLGISGAKGNRKENIKTIGKALVFQFKQNC